MTLSDIFADYNPGSSGFCIAVETHCGFEISRAEIERIAKAAAAACPDADDNDALAAEFERIWRDESWWSDDENAA